MTTIGTNYTEISYNNMTIEESNIVDYGPFRLKFIENWTVIIGRIMAKIHEIITLHRVYVIIQFFR